VLRLFFGRRGVRGWWPGRGLTVNRLPGRGTRLNGMGIGRVLIVLGLLLVAAGILVSLGDRLPFRLGRLPGDIEVRGRNSVFYFPLATSVVLSIALTLLFWLFGRR
jgi:hypothetical protein